MLEQLSLENDALWIRRSRCGVHVRHRRLESLVGGRIAKGILKWILDKFLYMMLSQRDLVIGRGCSIFALYSFIAKSDFISADFGIFTVVPSSSDQAISPSIIPGSRHMVSQVSLGLFNLHSAIRQGSNMATRYCFCRV